MSELLKKIGIFSILIGTFMFAINFLFGNTITWIQLHQAEGYSYYTIDFYYYLQQLQTTFTDTSMLELKGIERQWSDVDIINNLAYMLDIAILSINIMLYPIRVGVFTGKTVLSILGINMQDTNSGIGWLIITINFLTEMQIPYV